MYLIANGCSHTAGAEIEYVQQDYCYEKAWPKYLAEKLDYNYTNLAISGASNTRVIRTTITKIGELFLNKIKPEEIYVVILWPGPWRTEIYVPDLKDNPLWEGWVPLCPNNDEQYKKQHSPLVYNYYKYWVAASLHVTSARINYYIDVITLQNYLKAFKIKYLFWRASSTPLDKKNLALSVQIDKKYHPYIHIDTFSYMHLLKNNGFYTSFPETTHFGEDGHQFFGNYLFNYIHTNQLVDC